MGKKTPKHKPGWGSEYYYTVESFHINVGSGDGAIHIMTYGDDNTITQRQVVRAVFMDGGRLEGADNKNKKVAKGLNHQNRWTVNRTIEYIEKNYDCQNKHDNRLRFNYFIVTHWDSDHYAGIIRALNVFMRESWSSNFVINGKICMNRAFFKTDGSPESFFVAPYFTKAVTKVQAKGKDWDGTTLDNLRGRLEGRFDDLLHVDYTTLLVDIANPGLFGGWGKQQLQLRTECENLLGRNFLQDEDQGDIPANPDGVSSLTDLINDFPPQLHKPFDGHDLAKDEKPKKIPAMYCIAVNQRTMGKYPFGIYTTLTNKSSIVCMIVWKDGIANHRSHYLAGDADLKLEQRLLGWIVPGWDDQNVTVPSCSSMKLSHHGSRSSNPLDMMMALNPLSIFASAGSVKSHAHPRWELLAFMDIWDLTRDETGKNEDNPYHENLFFLTCYPIWLTLDHNKFSLAERNTRELTSKSFEDEYTELVNAYDVLNPGKPLDARGLLAGWHNLKNKNITQAQYICGRLCARLEQISHIRPGNLDLKAGGVALAQGNPVMTTNSSNVIFVQISSVGERSLEGVTRIHMTGVSPNSGRIHHAPLRKYLAEKPDWAVQQPPKGIDDSDDRGVSKNRLKKLARETNTLRKHPMKTRSQKKGEEEGNGISRIFSEEDEVWDLASLEDEFLEDFGDEDDFASISRLKPSQSQSLLRLDQPHYLVPETLSTPPANACVVRLPAAHPMFDFMEEMAWRLLIVDQKPVSGKDIPISEADEVAKWFATVHGNKALPLSIRFETWPPPNAVSTSDRDITLDATTIPVLSFDFLIGENKIMMDTTSAAGVLDGLDKSVLQDMTDIYAMLIFGLNPATPSFEVSLTDVAKFFGYSMDDFLLFRILGQMTLKLDIESTTATERKRNALWFSPGQNWETVLRLQFLAETPTINDLLRQHLSDFSISNAKVIGKTIATRKTERSGDVAACESQLTFMLDFDIGVIKLEASLELSETEVLLRLRNNQSPKMGLQDILSWLGKKLGENTLNLNELLQSASEILDASKVVFRGLDIVLAVGEDGKLTEIDRIGISFQVQVKIGEYDEFKGQYPVVFRFDFEWSRAFGPSLEGSLWLPTPDFKLGKYIKATPGWERHKVFEPLTDDPSKNADSLNLKTLVSSETVDNIPKGIPTDITQLSIRITKTGIRFQGKIQCEKPQDDEQSKVPQLYLDEVRLAAEYNWAKETRGFHVSLGVDIYLDPPNTNSKGEMLPDLEPARFRGDVIYDSTDKSWALSAHLEDLTVAHIASFWSERSRGGAMAFLERMVINYIELGYYYNGSSGAKSFTFKGFLSVGLLNFDLKYENRGEGDWEFVASVGAGANTNGATIKGILTDFIGEPPEELPEAVGDIEIGAPESGGELIKFRCFEKEEHTVFMFTLKVSKISLSFMQIRKIVAGEEGKNVKPKRIIKAAITDIPTIDVGIIGKLPQPFDQLFFLWTSDPGAELTKATDNKPRGLLKSELDIINSVENQAATEKLFFKKIKPDPEYKPGDVVISSGSHIFIVMKKPGGESNVLLDYAFKKSGANEKPKALTSGNDLGANDGEAPPGDNKGSKAPLKKSIGPLSIENIGLIYKNGKLGVMFDATFLMGPIGLSLLGFGVKVPFNKEYNLKNPPPISKVSFQLEGMVVSFDRPPLTVAGGFKRSEKDGIISYAGGLIIKFDPWQLQAAGVYASVPRKWNKTKAITGGNEVVSVNDNPQDLNDKFTMVFIYFKLNGPLFSVGFADISGLTGGFGVNSDITVPTIEQVVMFPFVKPGGTGDPNDSPLATINGLLNGTWFNPSEGKFWVAAGLKVSAFQMLNVDAVLVLKFNPGVQMGIYGVATCDVPSSKSPVKFAYVEMGISCTLDVEAGTFKVEAQLSPKSFVLHPSCHLTGGFALFSWFKDGENAVAGDWVMTIGGYHQAFVAPKQYPKPPRLRISWSLDDHLSVSGEAYFAITPKVCMGGGRLHAALSLGALYAFFDAYVDFLINFKPFHFQAEGGVSVGVRFTLDLWLVTIRISVEIGATLKLRGPPMGGIVHVDFWVFGFDIGFGESPRPAPKLSIEEFFQTALKDSKSTQGAMLSLTNGPDKYTSSEDDVEEQAAVEKAFLITCESGLEPEDKKETKEGDAWWVRPDDFGFQTTLKFAANDITFIKDFRVDNNMLLSKATRQTVAVPERCKNIYARPMEVTESVKSAVTVTVYQYSKDVCALRNTDPDDPKTDPQRSGNKSSELLSGTNVSIPLVMGLKIKPPAPEMSPDYIQQFNIVKDMKQSVYTDSTVIGFPTAQEGSNSWLPRRGAKLDANQVVTTWENSKFDPATVVTAWALKMKYKEGTTVTGARPKELLNRYKQMVPAMPLVAVGSSS
ncbi:hypothetical protein TWF970_005865 [Orbilia oligospora]|uniref:DUF6603 domain-containing protein n=1 Tax=Orbilia oligospora TaxID=2813651 RepID=A0A7C8RGE8_ORBOL|nr:hypothetical protein TWF970_005865 [Orbilia oligospora]